MTRTSRPVRAVRLVAKVTTVKHAAPVTRVVARTVAKAPAQRRGASVVAAFALKQVGKPYRFGQDGPGGYDCSGLTLAAYRQIGVSLPHKSYAQGRRGHHIAKSQRKAGDLLYWSSGHVAIYVGGGKMVDAPGRGRSVLHRAIWGNPEYRRL